MRVRRLRCADVRDLVENLYICLTPTGTARYVRDDTGRHQPLRCTYPLTPAATASVRLGFSDDMPTLVLLRHGQSTWNAENRFTGWVDVDLTPAGEEEARRAGELLEAEEDLRLDVCHTSVLTRAIRTADIALHRAGLSWLPVRQALAPQRASLSGPSRASTRPRWPRNTEPRRSRSGAAARHPPAGAPHRRPGHPGRDKRYRLIPPDALAGRQSRLKDVVCGYVLTTRT